MALPQLLAFGVTGYHHVSIWSDLGLRSDKDASFTGKI